MSKQDRAPASQALSPTKLPNTSRLPLHTISTSPLTVQQSLIRGFTAAAWEFGVCRGVAVLLQMGLVRKSAGSPFGAALAGTLQ
eukprot:CAMPEP_0174332522 /NCGR_PEP_ID=MMETSP0810-20121108/18375_1 /TAXON_ID=73025 ORGANISM="Eutreptiella gymnastica-like, Strain CCMP1594" /NCGR_SAMPLE_ID=MMETSP0810 /ASSEMBLY_ACC=CAM_ASM_000659 /LENGTH=83 /DNA_ID=CAMNT_0015449001 /DNA_START=956 /DNA_END=1204 /DNA_ORIENTATION=+